LKKATVILLVLVTILLSACGSTDINIVNEITTIPEEEKLTGDSIDTLTPPSIKADFIYDEIPMEEDLDTIASGKEITETDARIKGLGPDTIIQVGDTEYYCYTSGTVTATIICIPLKDGTAVLGQYVDTKLRNVWDSTMDWYFKDGQVDFVVYTTTNKSGNNICTFYDAYGVKLFARLSDEYYDVNNELLSEDALYQFTVRCGDATEFKDT